MHPVIFSWGNFTFYTFGLFAFMAFVSASFVIWKRGRENYFTEEDIFDAIILVTSTAVLGARMFYIITNLEKFDFSLLRWLSIFKIPGFSLLGALIFGYLGLEIVAKHKHWDFFSMADIAVTGTALGQAIGWLGALFAGFGMGKVVSVFGFKFLGQDNLRFPTQIIWSLGFWLLFIYLWKIEQHYRTFTWYKDRRSSAKTGFLLFSYFISIGVLQVVVATFNQASVYWLGISVEYILGIGYLLLGCCGLYARSGREWRRDLNGFIRIGGSNLKSIKVDLANKVKRIGVRVKHDRIK